MSTQSWRPPMNTFVVSLFSKYKCISSFCDSGDTIVLWRQPMGAMTQFLVICLHSWDVTTRSRNVVRCFHRRDASLKCRNHVAAAGDWSWIQIPWLRSSWKRQITTVTLARLPSCTGRWRVGACSGWFSVNDNWLLLRSGFVGWRSYTCLVNI